MVRLMSLNAPQIIEALAGLVGPSGTVTGVERSDDAVARARAFVASHSLVNVTVRPDYNFPNADAALTYGHGICAQISSGVSYGQLVNTIKSDFATNDEFQASYLISQSAQELCPAEIWQLRQS